MNSVANRPSLIEDGPLTAEPPDARAPPHLSMRSRLLAEGHILTAPGLGAGSLRFLYLWCSWSLVHEASLTLFSYQSQKVLLDVLAGLTATICHDFMIRGCFHMFCCQWNGHHAGGAEYIVMTLSLCRCLMVIGYYAGFGNRFFGCNGVLN
ncbi:hypothetical protein Nepgr_031727 [Nepenthes gracilis]|uniref:Uncharacterized protein n=1 Tax=Nepenthes gracilis TaxID=150966 RepID=A0AAD3TIT8_NEPGR|nr:hypothetical protein Nepgr_031727 [Nepenthes gracilis]